MRWLILTLLFVTAACAESKKEGSPMLKVSSPAFVENGAIPKKHAYKGEGDNASPAITWEGAPQTTKSFALVCDDPDAPRAEPWVHWVVYNIPAKVQGLPEGSAAGTTQGKTDFGTVGWGGPMPPKGHGTHHYHFKVYALDSELKLPTGQTKTQVLDAIKGHVVAEGELIGTYERK